MGSEMCIRDSYYEKGIHNVAPHEGVRTERHKLIHYYETNEWELFDLTVDPNELRSVYDVPSYAETQTALLNELGRLKEELRVPVVP